MDLAQYACEPRRTGPRRARYAVQHPFIEHRVEGTVAALQPPRVHHGVSESGVGAVACDERGARAHRLCHVVRAQHALVPNRTQAARQRRGAAANVEQRVVRRRVIAHNGLEDRPVRVPVERLGVFCVRTLPVLLLERREAVQPLHQLALDGVAHLPVHDLRADVRNEDGEREDSKDGARQLEAPMRAREPTADRLVQVLQPSAVQRVHCQLLDHWLILESVEGIRYVAAKRRSREHPNWISAPSRIFFSRIFL